MSTLRLEQQRIPGICLGEESSLPSISKAHNVQQQLKSALGEDDGLFVGYGFVANAFPYRQQDMYTRQLTNMDLSVAVLENAYLKAVFAPGLGGRLLSLYDKEEDRELLFRNPVFRAGNLAIRNAWFSGGVEWNMGMVGHGPYTASPIFAARLSMPDGTPVLRMYGYERIRRATWQMDFFLPEASRLLYCRMRIVNPRAVTIPMYWWSNIAVPALPGSRTVTAAREAYTYREGGIRRVPLPVNGGVDVTYPANNRTAVDFFFRVPDESAKFIASLDAQGRGIFQTSTARLQGRKQFVWGQGAGSDHWQEFLSDGVRGGGRYIELQAGLARTQYECLPMPPQTAWEWLEAYGSIQACPNRIHGAWPEAVAEMEARVAEQAPVEQLERLLAETRETVALRPAEELLSVGDGWGALEVLRREAEGEPPLSQHLDFGTTGSEQEPWESLLKTGRLGEADPVYPPVSWMEEETFADRLEMAVTDLEKDNWYAWLHHGVIQLQKRRFDKAREALERSCQLRQNAWALYGLSVLAEWEEDLEQAGILAAEAFRLLSDNLSLAKAAMQRLCAAELYAQALELDMHIPEKMRSNGRLTFYRACALAHTGELDRALALLNDGDGLTVDDTRESETSLCDLWSYIREKQKTADLDESPPYALDFRMSVKKG